MNQFVNQFQDNHAQLVDDLLSFYDVSLEEFNNMLAWSYIAIAGGYARRLNMVQNGIEMTPEDKKSYYTSDMDVFTISSYFSEVVKADPMTVSSHVDKVVPGLQAVITTPIRVKHADGSIEIQHKKVEVEGFGDQTFEGYNPYYAMQSKDFILDTRSRTVSVISLIRKSGKLPNCPSIQMVNASARKIKAIVVDGTGTTTNVDTSKPCWHTQRMVNNFDLSCSKYYISTLSHRIEDCVVQYIGEPVDNPYHTYINPSYYDSVSLAGRIVKYSDIGFMFSKEDLEEVMNGNQKILVGNDHLGGYTDDDLY